MNEGKFCMGTLREKIHNYIYSGAGDDRTGSVNFFRLRWSSSSASTIKVETDKINNASW